jgi:hypothetical protein
MTLFNEIIPNKERLLQEVEAFRKFLATNPVGERAQFLPFFAQHPQLCGYLAQLSQLALWNGDFWGVPGQNCESKQGGMMANPL